YRFWEEDRRAHAEESGKRRDMATAQLSFPRQDFRDRRFGDAAPLGQFRLSHFVRLKEKTDHIGVRDRHYRIMLGLVLMYQIPQHIQAALKNTIFVAPPRRPK